MKKIVAALLLISVLLSSCSPDNPIKSEDIAYKTSIIHNSFWKNSVDYYVVDKDGNWHGVSSFVWYNLRKEIPTR